MKNLIILGAGTAGTIMASKLAARLPGDWTLTVVDKDDVHVYQPGLLFVPFGQYAERDILRPRRGLFPSRVKLNLSGIEQVLPEERVVVVGDGTRMPYDVLIVATGTRLCPEETQGLTGEGWRQSAFDFYTLEGALALRDALSTWEGGRLVVNFIDLPIKRPVAPLKLTFLADAFFTGRNMRDRVDITYVTPLDAAFTKPRAAAAFGDLLAQRGVAVETTFAVSEVDGGARMLRSHDGREVGYDLLVTVPVHAGSEPIGKSGLADALGFVRTDKHTLQSKLTPEVFALGDATDLPTSKAGSVAHFQAEVLVENVLRFIAGQPLDAAFDGHANCFIETGYGKAMLIDFNYETEPLPGKYPLPGLGPFDLLAESAVNHWGKLGFKWAYWQQLLKGKELPIDHRMLMQGKWELTMNTDKALRDEVAALGAQVAEMNARLAYLAERQRDKDELIDELRPVLKAVTAHATDRLQDLEERGYFRFLRESVRVLDRVVESYGEDDVRALGDNIVRIMDTVRAYTQPQVLALANQATEVIDRADELEPTGILGMVRASRDEDVQRGMAVFLGVLRAVGKSIQHVHAQEGSSGARRPVRPRTATATRVAPSTPTRQPGAAAPAPGPTAPVVVDGVAFDAQGYLADASQWDERLAEALAASVGMASLSEGQWAVLGAARADYFEAGTSPNIRRLTKVAGITTKELYALFPKAPAMTVARLAGIPKPAGCI